MIRCVVHVTYRKGSLHMHATHLSIILVEILANAVRAAELDKETLYDLFKAPNQICLQPKLATGPCRLLLSPPLIACGCMWVRDGSGHL